MAKDLRSAQQVSSSSQDVYFLLEPGTTRVLLAHFGSQNVLSGDEVSSYPKKKDDICVDHS